jgi:hypothetical protein
MSAIVIVQRRAGVPDITHTVRNDDGVSIECSLEDFVAHMVEFMQSAPFIGTRNAFIAKMQAAQASAIQTLKESSVHNPPPPEKI